MLITVELRSLILIKKISYDQYSMGIVDHDFIIIFADVVGQNRAWWVTYSAPEPEIK